MNLPRKHCAFSGCNEPFDDETSKLEHLREHLRGKHGELLGKAMNLLPACYEEEDRLISVYNEAIAEKVRNGAPLASYAIDRRALKNFHEALQEDSIQVPMCFFMWLCIRAPQEACP